MSQEEYRFDEEPAKGSSKLSGVGKFIWNSETKEFCGRDGASWAKVSLFYCVFYTCLAGFFVGMLAVFMAQMPRDKPTYFGEDSTMARKENYMPGLGFRPQIDVEDHLIAYNPAVYESEKNGFKSYSENLKIFLNKYYSEPSKEAASSVLESCEDGKTYENQLATEGKSCPFDYKEIFKNTSCVESNEFGYKTSKPCVLVKLNKIISWKPQLEDGQKVIIKCEGETSVDKDNIKTIMFHSENDLNNSLQGSVDRKYFPYFNQAAYKSPFIFLELDVTPNTLVNIECKAFAKNIDASRSEKRGITKFSVFVNNEKN